MCLAIYSTELEQCFFHYPCVLLKFCITLPNLSPSDIYSTQCISQMLFSEIAEHLDSINLLIEIQFFNSFVTSSYLKKLIVNIRRTRLNTYTAMRASKSCFCELHIILIVWGTK